MTYYRNFLKLNNADPKPEKVEKKKKPINKVSKKRGKENKEYMTLRKVYLENNQYCQVKLNGCTKLSTEIHHAKKRSGFRLIDVANFVAICRNCHTKVENDNIKL